MLWLGIALTVIFTALVIFAVKGFRKLILFYFKGKVWHPVDWQGKHHHLKKIMVFFCILGFEIGMVNISERVAYASVNPPIHGTAEWIQTGTQQYLSIQTDDRYSLGFLEGKYLESQIGAFREALIFSSQGFSAEYNYTYGQMVTQAENYLPFIPEPYIVEMEGMADGYSQSTGFPIDFNEILLQNVYLDLSEGHWIPEEARADPASFLGCTDVGVQNSNGSIYIGQNFDFPHVLRYDSYFPSCAFVLTKLSGYASIFGLRLGAMLSLPIARTDKNITCIITLIEDNVTTDYQTPAFALIRMALENAQSADEMKSMVILGHNHTCAFTTMGTDGKTLYSYQCTPLEYRQRNGSVIVNTNRFIYDDWNAKYFAEGNYSLTRQEYVTRLATEKAADGNFTYQDLIDILGTRTDGPEGPDSAPCYDYGISDDATLAVFTGNQFAIGTVYQGLGESPIQSNS